MLGTILALRRAQIDEVRLARQQSEPTIVHSRFSIIFAVFTVILITLSTFASLFTMNAREWGGGDNIPLRTVRLITLPASTFLVSIVLFVARGTSVRRVFGALSKELRRNMTGS